MEICKRLLSMPRFKVTAALTASALCLLLLVAPSPLSAENERVVTIFHDGIEQTVVTDAPTVGEVLKRIGVEVHEFDSVEPGLPTQFVARNYNVNVYRARPVTVVDGAKRYQVMSPHTSARKIAEEAGLSVRGEDTYDLVRIDDFLGEDGVGLKLTVDRAIPVKLVLYGKPSLVYTQAGTIGDLLKEKNVALASADGTNLSPSAPLVADMTVEVWRDGQQTVTEEKVVAYPVEHIRDADQPAGYRLIKTAGKNGKKLVTYAIELRNGKEVARKELQSVVIEQAVKQVEVVGVKRGFSGSFQEALARLRSCEGKYTSISRNGLYYGAYQFNLNTWRSYAPAGFADVKPSDAPPEIQDQAAYNLYQKRGWQPWPSCSKKLGLQDIYR